MAPVVSTALISVIPLGIALLGALPLLLFFEIKNTDKAYNSIKSMTKEDIENQQKHMLEKKVIALNKQKIFLEFLNSEPKLTTELKDSSLMKDFNAVIKNRRLIKYYAIGKGFLDGCFFPLFSGWLLLDSIKVILTYVLCPPAIALTNFTPIGLVATAIIVGVTLLIGISYGIYSAYKANQIHEVKFESLEAKIEALKFEDPEAKIEILKIGDSEVKVEALKNELPSRKVLNKSLQTYDRLLRRFSDEQPLWTYIKKGLNRFLVVIKRLGTGSLVFRLVIWGPISAAVAASTAIMPAFFPIIFTVGTVLGGLLIAGCYLYAYNLESKFTQAGRVAEYLVQTEQLDSLNQDLQKAPVGKCVYAEKLSVKAAPNELVNSLKKHAQFSRSEVAQESSIAGKKKDNLDEVYTVGVQSKIEMPGNDSHPNDHKLFKYIQDTERNDQSVKGCIINTVITC